MSHSARPQGVSCPDPAAGMPLCLFPLEELRTGGATPRDAPNFRLCAVGPARSARRVAVRTDTPSWRAADARVAPAARAPSSAGLDAAGNSTTDDITGYESPSLTLAAIGG